MARKRKEDAEEKPEKLAEKPVGKGTAKARASKKTTAGAATVAAGSAANGDAANGENDAPKTFWAKSGYKGVSRVDHEKRKTHGWYVRVSFNGQMYSRFFSDSMHGGEQKALGKAVRMRNQIEREIGKPRSDRVIAAARTRNKSGILGVQRVNKGAGGAWQVTWSPAPNMLQRTSVSIAKYGDEEAFKRACRIRRQKERAIFGGLISNEEVPVPPQADA